MITRLITTIVLLRSASALYDSSDDVVELTAANFQSKVVDSDAVWIVEFYAPWCGHCKSLAPEYKKAAKALKGVVKIGAVNMDEHQSVGQPYGIRGFPTLKVFGANKKSPSDYNGQRTAKGITDQAISELQKIVNSRLGGGGGGSSGGGGGGSPPPKGDAKDVVELTDSNFKEKVLDSDDIWLVEFFAPWCGHCKNLAPHWQSAASQLKGKVKLGAVDATVHSSIASQYGVRGYPTIKYFPAGAKTGAEEYDGGRTSESIVEWAEKKAAENVPPPEVIEIYNDDTLKKSCDEHPICVIAVLPHILDCQTKCRNKYIDMLKQLGDKYRKNLWGWAWMEAAGQMDLEESMGIGGFGYPALAAVNVKKGKYSIFKGSFNYDGISDFLRDLTYGKGSTIPLRNAELPKLKKQDKWNGKDGEPPREDL